MNTTELDLLLAPLDESGVLADERRERAAALEIVATLPLTAIQQAWLHTAQACEVGEADEEALAATRVAAWDSIAGSDCDFIRPEVNQVRALICVLFPARGESMDDGEAIDRLQALLEFYLAAGGSAATAGAILRGTFDCD